MQSWDFVGRLPGEASMRPPRTSGTVKGFRMSASHCARDCTEAGVRKASKEETAGWFAPAVVSVYGDLMRDCESASSLSGKEAGRVSGARMIVAGFGAERRVLSR